MIHDYIMSYLDKARYEIIDNKERYYGEIPQLKGVWATGKTLESCRKELASVLEGWVILRLRMNLPIPGFRVPRLKIQTKKEVYA
ncbi:MAG: type II toxin-antitoxin system HicB family antitoxin [Candidatus Yonathbacteria bacterium]|nr:type II toxin-antitoxin system HicB family antitoxin [Candidatus Yonathbacteria bacterium]